MKRMHVQREVPPPLSPDGFVLMLLPRQSRIVDTDDLAEHRQRNITGEAYWMSWYDLRHMILGICRISLDRLVCTSGYLTML